MGASMAGAALPGLSAAVARLLTGNRAVLVGVPVGAADEVSEDGKSVPMAVVAATQEFGDPERNIPERPVLRQGVRNGRAKFSRINARSLRLIMRGQMSMDGALNLLGVAAVGSVQGEFVHPDPAFAPLQDSTVAARKRRWPSMPASTRPLVASGSYRQSISYVLDKEVSAKARVV